MYAGYAEQPQQRHVKVRLMPPCLLLLGGYVAVCSCGHELRRDVVVSGKPQQDFNANMQACCDKVSADKVAALHRKHSKCCRYSGMR